MISQSAIPVVTETPAVPSKPSTAGSPFLAMQSEINQVSTQQYVPTRISADEKEMNQIEQCFNSQESSERAKKLRSIFIPLMPLCGRNQSNGNGGHCVYGGLVGQSLHGTLIGLVHAMDDKLPVADECLSLMLMSTKAYFEKCANNDVRQLTAGHRHQVYRVGVVSSTVNGDEDLIRQETFTVSNNTEPCRREILRLIRFAHNCKSPLIDGHKRQVWQIFSSVDDLGGTMSLDEKRTEAVRRILVGHSHSQMTRGYNDFQRVLTNFRTPSGHHHHPRTHADISERAAGQGKRFHPSQDVPCCKVVHGKGPQRGLA